MDVLFQRHYVSKPEHVKPLEEIVERTIDASKMVRGDALLCVRIAYRPSIDDSTYSDVCKQISRLKGHAFSTTLEQSTEIPGTSYNGAGTGLSSMLFNSAVYQTIDKEPPVIISMDGDQYPINDVRLIEASKELSKRLRNINAPFGVGARTHVVLSADPKMNELRQIHEMFQSYIANKFFIVSNPQNLDLSDVSPCYRELRDSTPGFYAFNHGSPKASEIMSDLKKSGEKACFKGFALDYTLPVLLAKKEQKIEHLYVPTNAEHPSVKHSKDAVEGLIREQTHEVLQTVVGEFYMNKISSSSVVDELSGFFAKEDIRYVQNVMMTA